MIEASAEDGVAPEVMGEEDHLETDRDSFTPSTSLVGRGRTMLEGSYSFIENRVSKNSQSFPELLGRVGRTRWLELRLGWNYEVGGGGSVSGSEIGGEEGEDLKSETKVIYGLKLAVSEQRQWVSRAAVILHAATPTSGPGTATEYVAAVVGGWELPNQWSLDTSLRYVAASEEGDRFHQWAPSVVLKIPLGPRWNFHAEYFGIVSDDRAGDIAPQYLSPGVHFLISPDWEIGTRMGFGLTIALGAADGRAQSSESDLAKQTQNPVADLISVPFQANTSYRVGPRERTQNVLNIQPVVPLGVNDDWNLILRTIFPIVSQPSFVRGQDRQNGIGDTTISGFLSPKTPAFGSLIWGAGPVVTLPTASDERLGPDQWATGLTAVALASRGSTVFGALVNNVRSLEGRSFSQFLLQPFLNFNFPQGWYATSAPIITADWARSDDAWLVPVGGGFGKVHRIGKLPVNLSAQVFYNAEKPKYAGDWSTRFQIQLLFPK